MLKVTLDGCCV